MALPPRGRSGQRRRDIINRASDNAEVSRRLRAFESAAQARDAAQMQEMRRPMRAPSLDMFEAPELAGLEISGGSGGRTAPRPAIITPHDDQYGDQGINRSRGFDLGSFFGDANAADGSGDDRVDVMMDDGTIIQDVPASISQEELAGMVSNYHNDTAAGASRSGYVSAYLGGAGDQLTLGALDEIGSSLSAVTPWHLAGKLPGGESLKNIPNMWDGQNSFRDARDRAQRQLLGEMDANRENYPGTSLAGSVTGAIAPMFFTGGTSGAATAGGAAGSGGRGLVAGAKSFGREVAPVAAQSAIYGFNSGRGDVGDRLANVPGALAAGVGGYTGMRALGAGASRLIGGRPASPNVQLLADEGVTMTPGWRAGPGSAKSTFEETVLGSIPGPKQVVQAAHNRSFNDVRVATVNRVLKPIGGSIPRGTPINTETIAGLQDEVYGAYDNAIGNLALRPDRGLATSFQQIRADAPRLVGDQGMGQINATIGHLDNMLSQGALRGGVLRDTMNEIRGVATANKGTQIGDQLWRIHDEVDNALARQNGGQAAQAYRDARQSVSLLKRVEDAASRPGVNNGEFTPTHLRQATTRLGYGTTRANIANGTAPMFDLADAASSVMKSRIPNSGTPERAAALTLLGAGTGAGAAGTFVNPLLAAPVVASLGGYVPGVDRALQAFALNRPQVMRNAAGVIDRAHYPLGLLGMGSMLGLTER